MPNIQYTLRKKMRRLFLDRQDHLILAREINNVKLRSKLDYK